MDPVTMFAAASMTLDVVGGLFGFMVSKQAAAAAESRARMFLMEADADAQRYGEQAKTFKSSQKLAFLKAGVQLSGSPLDILAETVRVADENISAIRAKGRADALDAMNGATEARVSGRNALVSGITGAAQTGLKAYGAGAKAASAGVPRAKVAGIDDFEGRGY